MVREIKARAEHWHGKEQGDPQGLGSVYSSRRMLVCASLSQTVFDICDELSITIGMCMLVHGNVVTRLHAAASNVTNCSRRGCRHKIRSSQSQ